MTTLNQETLDWWNAHFAAQERTPALVRKLRERRRKWVWEFGIVGVGREVDLWFGAAIFVVPYVFAWFLLRRGHSSVSRILGFGWLAFCFIFFLLPGILYPPPPGQREQAGAPSIFNPSDPPPVRFASFGDDVGSMVAWLSEGQVDMDQVGISRPQLHEALVDAWWEVKSGSQDPVRLADMVAALLEATYCAESGWTEQGICAAVARQKTPCGRTLLQCRPSPRPWPPSSGR